ncbi:hypothetical protein BT96DRAFT_968900 [Gymnopus androsaceus JB14]|uniref:F-box domain-containing protein n=1 Tax=Gymnopus androsaceus JB14 TaxID=1447944 RepID=A0A6A4IM04_9AGAR|nr:hypothetical protein BT96DRAFT_968900 [Gymnopus androsaceus JB14]
MNLTPRSNLGHSLTLKRRRGRRNLKHIDNIHPELANNNKRSSLGASQRPSSSGASYNSASSIPLSDGEEEADTRAREPNAARELTRSMTADVFSSSTRPWDGKDIDIQPDSDVLSDTSSLESESQVAFINQLPNELLTLIFAYGSELPQFELRYPLTPVPPFKTPSLIESVMCVCSRWRQLAMHTPSLWTSLLVTRSRGDLDRLPSVADFQKPMNSISQTLQRTLNLPLDITLDCTHISTKTVIRQLAAESERWRSLSIIVPTTHNLPAVLSHLKDIHAPILECLVITAHKFHEGDVPNLLPPQPFLKSSPRLSTVRLNRVGLRWSASPLRNLTTLELRFILWPTHSDFQNLFSNSPDLQNLKLHFDTHAFARLDRTLNQLPNAMVRPLIKIPCLRALETAVHIPRFIIHTQPLEELVLKDFGTAEWCRSLVYFRYYAKTFPKLTKLVLDRVKDIIYVDSSLVRAFPKLKSLHLVRVYSSAFCRLLCGAKTLDTGASSNASHQVDVWPGLEELTIEEDPEGKIDLVAEAVRARKNMGRELQRLNLDRAFFDKAEREDKGEVVAWLKGVTEVKYI